MKEKYLKIYYECLQKEYSNKLIEPLLHMLYGLVICYEEGIKDGKYIDSFNGYNIDNLRVDFVSKIIDLFTKIININKQNKVYDICRLLMAINSNVSTIPFRLKVIFFPKEADFEDGNQYFSVIGEIILWYKNNENNSKLNLFESLDSDFREIIYLYNEYLKNIPSNNKDEIYCLISFVNYMENVIAYYYKEKCDINIFPKVMDFVFNNIDYLDDFIEMNTDNYENHSLGDLCVNKIMDSCINNKRVIK